MTIEIRGITHRYGETLALEDVNLDVAAGEVVGYLGPNGAGKSTTVKLLLGLMAPTTGTIRVAGIDIARDPIEVRRRVGYLPEIASLFEGLTPLEHALFSGRIRGLDDATIERRTHATLAAFDLTDRMHDPIRGFSKGMRQKVSILLATLHAPQVLLLDEPLSGLDAGAARILKELVRGFAHRGAAVLYCSHVLDVVERVCDRAAILDHGRIVALGTIEELRSRTSETTLEAVFQSVVESIGDPAERASSILAELSS